LFADQDPILFGTFSQSFFTMFQSCTGDGWASGVARTMFHENGKVFFSSYDMHVFDLVSHCVPCKWQGILLLI
jgi:hypothetical protein